MRMPYVWHWPLCTHLQFRLFRMSDDNNASSATQEPGTVLLIIGANYGHKPYMKATESLRTTLIAHRIPVIQLGGSEIGCKFHRITHTLEGLSKTNKLTTIICSQGYISNQEHYLKLGSCTGAGMSTAHILHLIGKTRGKEQAQDVLFVCQESHAVENLSGWLPKGSMVGSIVPCDDQTLIACVQRLSECFVKPDLTVHSLFRDLKTSRLPPATYLMTFRSDGWLWEHKDEPSQDRYEQWGINQSFGCQ